METETDIIERLARIEVGITNMGDNLKRLAEGMTVHGETLTKHEARIAVLESKSNGWKTAVAIISPIVALVALFLAVADRLYG